MRLAGKVALISGAAAGVQGEPMGFGGASAWLFVREGAKVVLGDVNEELGRKTAAQIRESGGEAMFVRLDVTIEQDWIDVVQATVSSFGRLDIVVNNAGIAGRENMEQTTAEIWDAHMAIHARGVFLGTKHAIPELRRVGGGSIINISSFYGMVGSPGSPAYSAAKGAVRIFTKSAAIQYAKDRIRVNSVHPGPCLTPMGRSVLTDPERLAALLAQVPAGRFGNADDTAYGILYLASDESAYVTGAELVIDGGITAQ